MYRHLDDPAPPAADAARYREVLRRSAALRSRALHRRVTAGLVGLLCASLAVNAWLAATSKVRPISSRESAYQFNQQTRPLAPGTPVPAGVLTDVVLASTQDGYGLADHRGRLVLAATVDGGSTWRVAGGQLPTAISATVEGVEMEFTSPEDGYLWRAPTGGSTAAPMWVTHDGGASWTEAAIGPLVFDVSAIDANVWALVASCPPAATTCDLQLEVSTDGGSSWAPATSAVPAVPWNPSQAPAVELARVTRSRSYVLTDVSGALTLAFTADGGSSWTTRSVPCTDPFDKGAELALSATSDLWLLCGGQASGGSQAKALYRSGSGGAQWALAAETTAVASGVPRPPDVGSLPLAGYVAPYSIGHKNLAVLTSKEAWLFPTGGDLVATADGGSSWSPVPSLNKAGFGTGAPGNVTFTSTTDGWIVELGVGLWHTTDGSTWQPLGT